MLFIKLVDLILKQWLDTIQNSFQGSQVIRARI